jgi:hypothetical protein
MTKIEARSATSYFQSSSAWMFRLEPQHPPGNPHAGVHRMAGTRGELRKPVELEVCKDAATEQAIDEAKQGVIYEAKPDQDQQAG